ncbi:MAG: 30S ribosomal protein S15 [Chloroflexi bacterium]|nr:30S ribosomal protein S15 [Chloroflexota bacterium]
MPLSKEVTAAVIERHRINEKDVGSADVQIALLTSRIRQLQQHLENNKHDHHSRRGLLMMVGKRRRLLNYLARDNHERYRQLIAELGLRR